ncbi:MAG: uncharacterized protein QOG63_159 [Thermoleophilaceae bacterium]|nr:uncharacterized protein [Thermoleophilaceae bacterium]
MDPLIVLFGLGVGILVGLTGMGGGSLMTPLLIVVFGVKPVVAVGSDLAYGAITKTVGGWRHLRHGTVDMGLSTWICIGSVPSAIGGVYVLQAIEDAAGSSFDDVMLFCLAGALLFTGTAVLIRSLFSTKLVDRERFDPTLRNKIAAVVLGAFVGFVLGITSAGSGTLIAVGLILIFRLAPRQVVGTDVFQAAILLWAAAAAHVVAGNVDWPLVGNILIGSLPGVWIGSHLITKVRVEALRLGLAIVLIGSGLGILTKAGVDIPAPVLAGVPLVLAVVLFGHERLARRRGVSVATSPITAPER